MREYSPLPFAQLITSHSQSRSCFLAFSFTIHNRFPYRIPREKFSALDLNTGEVEELDEADRLTEFIDSWQEVIAARVIATLNPICDFDYQQMDDRVEKVLRQPQPLPAPPRKGQKHVTVAIWKRLLENDYTICVGEMGVGKTTIAVSVAALLGDEGYPALVICPPHLVGKWIREIRGIWAALMGNRWLEIDGRSIHRAAVKYQRITTRLPEQGLDHLVLIRSQATLKFIESAVPFYILSEGERSHPCLASLHPGPHLHVEGRPGDAHTIDAYPGP